MLDDEGTLLAVREYISTAKNPGNGKYSLQLGIETPYLNSNYSITDIII
jgi:hypothetical protein